MSRLQAEERRELRHRPVALRASGVGIGLVREARVRRNALQCPGFLYACCGQGQIVRALLFACWMDLFVQPAQPLHARDCVIHLVLLNVFQFVNVETFLVSFGDENEGYSELFSSGWIVVRGGSRLNKAAKVLFSLTLFLKTVQLSDPKYAPYR